MAVIKFHSYSNRSEQTDITLMENNISKEKCERTSIKPPILPKPKIILPPPRKLLNKSLTQDKRERNVDLPLSPSGNIEDLQSSSNLNQNDNLNKRFIDEDNEHIDSIIQRTEHLQFSNTSHFIGNTSDDQCTNDSFNSFQSIQLNESEFSSSNIEGISVEGDKESDSDLTDSASQRSIDAVNIDETFSDTEAFLIANELATSELSYIESLRLIVISFREFIEDYCKRIGVNRIISDNDLAKIISSLPQLLSLNEDLYNDLKKRVDNWHEMPKIADVIIKKGPFLKLYTTYIKEFETVCTYLDEFKAKYPKFADALNEFESLPLCKSLNLKHYMLKPVQRIPQYRLLLQNYINHVRAGSDEHSDAIKALQIIQQVLSHTNDTLNLDNLSKLLQIQAKLGTHEIIKPGRKFLREGELYKLSRKEVQLRFFILLSDCLLYTSYVTLSIFKVKYELPLFGMKVHTKSTEKYEFSIITSTRSFTLRARNSNEYCEWVNALKSAIEENNQRQLSFAAVRSLTTQISQTTFKLGQEAPVWIQDKRATMCQICSAEFTMTFRRHHCRCCGKVVCSKCSSNKAPLAYLRFHCARVCKPCYDYLLKELTDPDRKLVPIVQSVLSMCENDAIRFLDGLLSSFKSYDSTEKNKKFIPQRLKEVAGDEIGEDISTHGWLMRRGKRGWKRLWFVLKAKVLYEYKASHDVVAHRTLPVLGYTVSRLPPSFHDECTNLCFSLNHPGQSSLVFMAPSEENCQMWISALTDATVLK
ncbi:hypothetical protein O3M35_013207 [Rhynocoris fuscipes]|uniref:Uncharacterized protein n=1 Tax=Rhynocoris fuscipes TaxID=488301 RepID=A0AAW1CE51_9HEMI